MKTLTSEYISTRLSHDIAGNIGAVANAVELLEEDDMDFLNDIKSILKTASKVLSYRIKFFRMAFGTNNPNLQDLEQIKDVINSYLSTVGGNNSPEADFGQINIAHSKMIMLIVMIIADLLIKGGIIHINQCEGKTFIAIDDDVRISENKLAQNIKILNNNTLDYTAQDAPLLYLLEICAKQGIKLEYGLQPSLHFVLE